MSQLNIVTCGQCNGSGGYTERTELVEGYGFADTADEWIMIPKRTILTRQVQCPVCGGRGTVERFVNE